jgi:hypothetical protein
LLEVELRAGKTPKLRVASGTPSRHLSGVT